MKCPKCQFENPEGIKRNERRIIVCPEAKALDFMARVFPKTAVRFPAWSFEFIIRHNKGEYS
jgi:hypothetical protein